jgi:hypothetical protein
MNPLFLGLILVVGFFLGIAFILKIRTVRLRRNLKKGDKGHFYVGEIRHYGYVKRMYQNGHLSVYSCEDGLTYRLANKKQFSI